MTTSISPHPSTKSVSNLDRAPRKESVTQSSTDRVVDIVQQLASTMHLAIDEIRDINENAKLLSLNARIEAARAGSSGAAFGVVAQEMQGLSNKTASIADDMANKTQESISDLIHIIGGNVRGSRLADLALNNIDLVDRNLYERTCDVRWWATDSALVQALESHEPSDLEFASKRMGIILNAYTVYHDLILCDLSGKVLANGRPQRFNSTHRNESRSNWFTRAIATRTGDEFGFQSAHASPLVDDQFVLIYSATVRKNGEVNGNVLGVLGVVFNWKSFSDAIMNNDGLDTVEAKRTLRLLVDDDGAVLASSRSLPSDYRFPFQRFDKLVAQNKGYALETLDNKRVCIAYAKSPGFETYKTGWHSVLIQDLD